MTARRINIFFYGLFMDEDVLRAQGVQTTGAKPVRVRGFELRIGQRATLVPSADARVYGILMKLTHDEIERLYAEPGVQMYRPEAVIAELEDGSQEAALCFNLPLPPSGDEPNQEYTEKLRELARRLRLPDDYVEEIT